MFRGEFHRGDGLVIPNNVTTYGVGVLLAAALTDTAPTFFVGLVDGAPASDLLITQVGEPTFTNGYARVAVARSAMGWPVQGTLNGEPFFETGWLEFASTGNPFSRAIRRMMLIQTNGLTPGDTSDENRKILALSTPLPDDLLITAATPLNERRFKYRLYAR